MGRRSRARTGNTDGQLGSWDWDSSLVNLGDGENVRKPEDDALEAACRVRKEMPDDTKNFRTEMATVRDRSLPAETRLNAIRGLGNSQNRSYSGAGSFEILSLWDESVGEPEIRRALLLLTYDWTHHARLRGRIHRRIFWESLRAGGDREIMTTACHGLMHAGVTSSEALDRLSQEANRIKKPASEDYDLRPSPAGALSARACIGAIFLFRIAKDRDEVADALVVGLRYSNPLVKAWCAEIISIATSRPNSMRVELPETALPLIEQLSDSREEVRAACLDALKSVTCPVTEDLNGLVDLLSHSSPLIRARSARAIGQLGSESPGALALTPLAKLLSDSDEDVRAEAGIAIMRIAPAPPSTGGRQ